MQAMTQADRPACVFLDKLSIDCEGELDFSAIIAKTDFTAYDNSTADQVMERAADAEIIITNKVTLGKAQIKKLPRLKLICVIATGTNNIDFAAADEYGISVKNVKDYAAASVSQHVLLLMLSLSSQFLAYQQDIKQGKWQQQDQFCLLTYPIQLLQGRTLGLIGYGHIAKAVEKLARAFGMNIMVCQSLQQSNTPQAGRHAFADLIKEADFISVHCPLSELSENLFGKQEFRMMKETAYIINTARGGIINETDLLQALQSGQIAGAALDCLQREPPHPEDTLITANLQQLIITPHNAWGSQQARQALVDGTAENINLYMAGN